MNKEVIKCCERAHYFMQLSSYFTELMDLPGVSFAYTNLVSDTWYNQAYNIQDLSSTELAESNESILSKSRKYFEDHNRELCFYLTPATTPTNFKEFLKNHGFTEFDKEAWMFYNFSKEDLLSTNPRIKIKDITDTELDLFSEVYCNTLPGPEVAAYVQCVKNGFLSRPPFININYFVAFYDEKPVGMLSLLIFGKYAGLYAVAVDEGYQNMGICKALVAKSVDICRKQDIEYLFLQTGNGEDSQVAFEHLNFETKFVRIGYIQESALKNIQHG